MTLSRRQLISRSGAAGVGAAALAIGLSADDPAAAAPGESHGRGKLFPPLQAPTGALLALPAGFSYEVVAEAGETELSDVPGGAKTPENIDGTGVFRTSSGYRLVQNHELSSGAQLPVPHVDGTVYDAGVIGGGCTVVDVTRSGSRRSEWVGLSGTIRNCAGGVTPWHSWLTCEETELKAGPISGAPPLELDHGWVFEVFPRAASAQIPKPIKAWGRYPHEAVVVAPNRTQVYLTEDASTPNGLLYRWTAPDGYRLRPRIADELDGTQGKLEALAVLAPDGSVLPDLAYVTSAQIGRPFRTRWVEVPDRLASGNVSVRNQFPAAGVVTRSKKLEGAWGTRRGLYFDASFAFAAADLPANATKHDGQVWYYNYADETLTLKAYFPYNPILHSNTPNWETALGQSIDLAFDGPDNLHVSPYGSLVLAEDGNTANHLISWSERFGAQAIARNLIVQQPQTTTRGNVYSEMTGPTFTPNGSLLFANVFAPGHTFVIRGPWRSYLG
jgi:secreted PhoX family phosphatase